MEFAARTNCLRRHDDSRTKERDSGKCLWRRGGSFDPRDRTSPLFSRDTFQNPALWYGNHHDAGGNLFARRIPSREFQRMAKKQLFEPDWFTCPIKRKSQGSSAEPTDRPGRDFQWPHSSLVDPKLGVDWSMR